MLELTLWFSGLMMYFVVYFLVVSLHTAGHFIAAKLLGVGVAEVAVGYGKVVRSITRGGTTYSLRRVPLWCRVFLYGDLPPLLRLGKWRERVESSLVSSSAGSDTAVSGTRFADARLFIQWAVIIAGPLSSLAAAWLIIFAMFMTRGVHEESPGPIAVAGVSLDSPAERAGLKTGDRIISIDGQPVEGSSIITSVVKGSQGRSVELVIERMSEKKGDSSQTPPPYDRITIIVTPERAAVSDTSVNGDTGGDYRIGIGMSPLHSNVQRFRVWRSIHGANRLCRRTLRLFERLVFPESLPASAEEQPIEMMRVDEKSEERSPFFNLVTLIAFMIANPSIFLFAINVLPLPFLDGGRFVRVCVRAVVRSKGSYAQ